MSSQSSAAVFSFHTTDAHRRRLVLPTHTHTGAHLLIWPLWCGKTSTAQRFHSIPHLSLSLLLVFVSPCLIRARVMLNISTCTSWTTAPGHITFSDCVWQGAVFVLIDQPETDYYGDRSCADSRLTSPIWQLLVSGGTFTEQILIGLVFSSCCLIRKLTLQPEALSNLFPISTCPLTPFPVCLLLIILKISVTALAEIRCCFHSNLCSDRISKSLSAQLLTTSQVDCFLSKITASQRSHYLKIRW